MTNLKTAGPLPLLPGTPSVNEGPSDAELLASWAAGPDPAALELLVRRHGTLVFGVCRRVLGRTPDAEDAFQATFLILAQKGGTLSRPGQVAGWLHGVALRVARRVRADRVKRWQREEAMATEPPAPDLPDDQTDLRRVLDEELDRLPDKYRLPIVLCELEGLTLDEAARQLGWPKGTVAGRLSRGRDILRRRLSRRRGLVLPVVMLGAPGLSDVPALAPDLPDSLVSATVTAAGRPDGPAALAASAHAAALAREALARRVRFLIVALLSLGLAFALAAAGVQAGTALGAPADSPASSCHPSTP